MKYTIIILVAVITATIAINVINKSQPTLQAVDSHSQALAAITE